MSEEKAKTLLETLPRFRHYIIRDTINEGQADAGTKLIVARCDKYSDYATSENATWMKEVTEMVEKLLDDHKKELQGFIDDLKEEMSEKHELERLLGQARQHFLSFPTNGEAWKIYLEAEKNINHRLHQRTCVLWSKAEKTSLFWEILVLEWVKEHMEILGEGKTSEDEYEKMSSTEQVQQDNENEEINRLYFGKNQEDKTETQKEG